MQTIYWQYRYEWSRCGEHLGTIAVRHQSFLRKNYPMRKTRRQFDWVEFGVGFLFRFYRSGHHHGWNRVKQVSLQPRRTWVSDGTGEFTTETIEKSTRGTTVILHITDEREYLDPEIKSLVNKYSDHISLPSNAQKKFGKEEGTHWRASS